MSHTSGSEAFIESLPVFDAANEHIVYDPRDLAHYPNLAEFSRVVRIIRRDSANQHMSLEEVIPAVEEQQAIVAAACGAVVVPHTYGLIRLQEIGEQQHTTHYDRRAIVDEHPESPTRYILGAKVEVIHKYRSVNRRQTKSINRALDRYYNTAGDFLGDVWVGQFSSGTTETYRQRTLFLHDIDLTYEPNVLRTRIMSGIFDRHGNDSMGIVHPTQ